MHGENSYSWFSRVQKHPDMILLVVFKNALKKLIYIIRGMIFIPERTSINPAQGLNILRSETASKTNQINSVYSVG